MLPRKERSMLRHTALGLAALSLPAAALAAPDGWSPLLEPAELAAILDVNDDVRVVHVTGAQDQLIPGAVFSPYGDWRGGPNNPGALRDVMEFEDVITRLGIDADTPVVVVHGGANPSDMGAAARVYWTLKSLGVQDLALLNGGFAAWAEASLPVTTEPAVVQETSFQPEWDNSWYVSTEEVAVLTESGEARIIDSRPRGFFDGIDWSIARPGTVRNAESVVFADFMDGNRMLGAERAREIAAANGLTDAPLTVNFCNTGHWAAINWFALSEVAGVDNTRLYAESMAEYATRGHALDNEPSRIAYLWRSTRKWVSDLF
jgi:thiosulfate/3-mercaptopyruvate sulfurtransferase